MSTRGKHGNHRKGPRVERVSVKCAYCNTEKLYLPSHLQQHPTKYCSKSCAGMANRNRQTVKCGICDVEFERRKDKIKQVNYCSLKCSAKSKMLEGARWRNKEHIKLYMKEYSHINRVRLNLLSKERVRKNIERRKQVCATYRLKNKESISKKKKIRQQLISQGDLTRKRWKVIKEKFNNQCVCCGRSEPDVRVCMDHIIPLSKGGDHTENNVQPLCVSCNSAKGTQVIDYRANWIS